MTTDHTELTVDILNKEGVKEFLKDLTFPVYFLDFECISNSKQWMFDHGMSVQQQITSFSILRIDSLDDDETSIKHYSQLGLKEDYSLMAKKLTDFYRDKNGTVVVWGKDLEVRSLAWLINKADESKHKKLSYMLSNILDLQQLFYEGSFISIKPFGKSKLEDVAMAYEVYLKTKLHSGKKAHYLLEHASTHELDEKQLSNINRRIEDYNNSDVINIKRILVKIMEQIK